MKVSQLKVRVLLDSVFDSLENREAELLDMEDRRNNLVLILGDVPDSNLAVPLPVMNFIEGLTWEQGVLFKAILEYEKLKSEVRATRISCSVLRGIYALATGLFQEGIDWERWLQENCKEILFVPGEFTEGDFLFLEKGIPVAVSDNGSVRRMTRGDINAKYVGEAYDMSGEDKVWVKVGNINTVPLRDDLPEPKAGE